MKTFACGTLLVLSVLGGGALAQPMPTALIEPAEAVALATAAGPERGVKGTFLIKVKSTGGDKRTLFLNSGLDYQDSKNLSVEIEPRARKALEKMHGADLQGYFRGKTIEATGIARQVRIYFGSKPRRVHGEITNASYFQNRIVVSEAAQIRVRQP